MTSCRVSRSMASIRSMSAGPMAASFGAALLADRAGGGFRDGAGARHALGGEGLDLEPDAVAVFRGPDSGHFRAAVTRNHAVLIGKSGV